MLTLRELRHAISTARRRGVAWESPVFVQEGNRDQTMLDTASVTIEMEAAYDYEDGVRRYLRVGNPVLVLRGE